MMAELQPVAAPSGPRPGKLLVLLSVLVIGACLLGIATCLAVAARPRGDCATDEMAALVLLPPLLLLGVQQYRGVFHRRPGAAVCAAILIFACGCLYGFVSCLMILMALSPSPSVAGSFEHRLGWGEFSMLGMAVMAYTAAWQTWNWSFVVRTAGASGAVRTFTLRELLAAVTVVALIAGVVRSHNHRPPRIGVNVAVGEAPSPLPTQSKDICYRIVNDDATVTIEFTIDEQTFRTWVAQVVDPSAPANAPPRALVEVQNAVATGYRGDTPLVAQGLEYSWETPREKTSVIFDRQTERVYFFRKYRQ